MLSADSPEVAWAIAGLPWVRDGVNASEAGRVERLIALAIEDPELASAILALTFVQSGQRRAETEAMDLLLRLAARRPSVARNIVSLEWAQDAMTPGEERAVNDLLRLAGWNASAADALASYQWVRDGVGRTEAWAIQRVTAISDPENARFVTTLPWLAEGLTDSTAEALGNIALMARLHPAGEAGRSLAWVRDGVTDVEAVALDGLAGIARARSNVAGTLLTLSWIQDGITANEVQALQRMRSALGLNFASPEWRPASIIRALPWLQDGITVAETDALEHLWEIGRDDRSAAERIIGMLSPESITAMEAHAVGGLNRLRLWSTTFQTVVDHLELQGGITESMAPVIAAVGGAGHLSTDSLVLRLIEPGGALVERRTIATPLAGEVELAIVRTRPGAANRMDYLEHAVRTAEDFIRAPFPTKGVVLLYEDDLKGGRAGGYFGESMALLAAGDVADENGGSLMHETAHYYWHDSWHANPSWVIEGAASFMAAVALESLSGRPLEIWGAPCPYIRTIAEFTHQNSEWTSPVFSCSYSLGERLFMDLYRTLGEDRFRQGFRSLYLASRDRAVGIRHVREAFGADDEVVQTVVARWYDGSAPYDLSGLDAGPVDPTLSSISGRVTRAFVTHDGQGDPATTFSAGTYRRLVLELEFTNQTEGVEESLDLEVVEFYEDGFAFAKHTLTLDVAPNNTGSTGRIFVGTGGDNPALGTYYVYVYDGDRKVAEVQYTVTA